MVVGVMPSGVMVLSEKVELNSALFSLADCFLLISRPFALYSLIYLHIIVLETPNRLAISAPFSPRSCNSYILDFITFLCSVGLSFSVLPIMVWLSLSVKFVFIFS